MNLLDANELSVCHVVTDGDIQGLDGALVIDDIAQVRERATRAVQTI